MPRHKIIPLTVEGSGTFPLDMLRYDQCAPAGPDDVAKIEGRMGANSEDIGLASFSSSAPPPNSSAQGWLVKE